MSVMSVDTIFRKRSYVSAGRCIAWNSLFSLGNINLVSVDLLGAVVAVSRRIRCRVGVRDGYLVSGDISGALAGITRAEQSRFRVRIDYLSLSIVISQPAM